MGCVNVSTNINGIPYLATTNVTVSDTSVDLALGFRSIQPVGTFFVRLAQTIPTGTTGTLPITLTLNGTTRQLTTIGGAAVTAAELTGTGVFEVFNDRFNGILQVVSPLVAGA